MNKRTNVGQQHWLTRTPSIRLKNAVCAACAWVCLSLAHPLALAQTTQPGRAAAPSGLPSLGDISELPSADERRIGERIAREIYQEPDYLDDPVLAEYVQGIWQPLLAAARARGDLSAELDERFAWQLFLVRDRSVNAFALPGGYFGRHISRLLTAQSRQAPWMIGAMILAGLIAAKNPGAANAAIVGSQALSAQGTLNFSRDMEREADRVGYGIMLDAGFDAKGAAGMFEKLQQSARLNDNGNFPYLRSHPLSTQRIAEAQARNQLPSGGFGGSGGFGASANPGARAWVDAMMSARARVLADPGVDRLRRALSEAQTPAPASARTAGVLYGGALAAGKLRDYVQANALVARLQEMSAAVPSGAASGAALAAMSPSGLAALLALELRLSAPGVTSSGNAGSLPPGVPSDLAQVKSRAQLLTYGRALLAAGQPKAVAESLSLWVTQYPNDAAAWQLLATAHGNLGQNVRAIRADAEVRVAQLDYPAALDRLKAAQNLMRSSSGAADFVEGSIIDARSRQVELLVRQQALQDKVDR
jgi:predicted Zn-dependent protease